ncbi:MAG: hypothetical protein NZM11_11680, partial [Anaerolineales bacterium]|nr:hypothetical protein [Anaerolineales bacterium]
IAGAWIEVYRAKPYPVWYGKTFEGPPDFVVVTDANGRANLGPKPFGDQIVHTYGHANGLLALLIKTENKVGVKFLEVTEFNLAYGRGDRQRAVYPVVFTNYKTVTTPFILRRVFLPLVMR